MSAVSAGKLPWKDSLDWWQQYRQARVDRVTDLTNEMNKRRLPGWTGQDGKSIDSSWLFSVQIDKDVADFTEKH